ncbi:hypothetical protein [Polaribacter sp. Hel_I_88]|uniref:hypothetical protein n=1 Tax=Polaribacter sp. Hel_I_88 TaxID=1250006 RepID=UPI0004794E34|nr:hypothetical protein [Polaribacter sp. Hel_I_88]
MTNSIITINDIKFEARPYSTILQHKESEAGYFIQGLNENFPYLYGRLYVRLKTAVAGSVSIRSDMNKPNESIESFDLNTESQTNVIFDMNLIFNKIRTPDNVVVYFDGLMLIEIKE